MQAKPRQSLFMVIKVPSRVRWRLPLFLAVLIALPELVLVAADLGLLGSVRWRLLSYQYGAFWSGLLHGWTPNYPLQPATMFLSYSFLHGSVGHLLGNLAGLAWLGPPLVGRLGPRRFLMVWITAVIGGALAFGVLSRSPAPMAGASGALFGLAGAWIALEWRDIRLVSRRQATLWLLSAVLLLVIVNLVSWYWESGNLAWQTHLGGAITGASFALWRDPNGSGRPKPPFRKSM